MPEERNDLLPSSGRPLPLQPPAGFQGLPANAQPVIYFAEPEPQDEVSLPLSHYLWVLRRHLWKILAFIVIVLVATTVVTLRLTPIYESTATLYVDRNEARGIVGQEAQVAATSTLDAESFLASQIRLLQSDSVVRPVAQRYNLLEKEQQFAKDSDRGRAQDAPIVLRRLKVSRPPNTYLLQVSYRSTDPQLAADVANGIAASYIEHTYNIRIRSSQNLSRFMERQIEELRAKMEASSAKVAQIERELNVVNPEERTSILTQRLTQLNAELTRAQAERVRFESEYNATRSGELEAAQVSAQGEGIRKLIERRNELEEKFAEIKAHFGVNHPEYRKAQASVAALQSQIDAMRSSAVRRVEVEYRQALNRETLLAKDVAEAKAEIDRLAGRYIEYQRAKREADADKTLFEELNRKIREAGINAGFQNNMVRVADPARAAWKPVFPKLWLNLLLAFLFSSLAAVGAAILSDTLDNTVRDPEQATRSLRTHIVGTLPSMRNSKDLQIPAAFPETGRAELILANGHSQPDRSLNSYEEAIRTIRSTILLSDFDRRVRTLLFTSATASEGKSTSASHLAWAHAEQGKRTLLIDCDVRRPSQHKMFGMPVGLGLSNVLNGEIGWREVLSRPENNANLDVITAGPPSRRAADKIGSTLVEMLDEMSREYDLVILDAPPLLGFAESLQLAAAADGVILVTKAGDTSRKAVAAALSTLSHLRANTLGVILNQVKKHHSDHYHYYGYYGNKKYARPAEEN